jgi:hypothetical protein
MKEAVKDDVNSLFCQENEVFPIADSDIGLRSKYFEN